MIGNIVSHIEKNPSKWRTYLASVDFSILQIAGASGGRQRSHTQKTTFKKKKAGNLIINWYFLFYTICCSERILLPSDRI